MAEKSQNHLEWTSLLFSQAMAHIRSLHFLLSVQSKIIHEPNEKHTSFTEDENWFIMEEKRTGQHTLSSLIIVALWDHARAMVVEALADLVTIRPGHADSFPAEHKIRKILERERNPQSFMDDISELKEVIDRFDTKGKEGLDTLEHLISMFNVPSMNSSEQAMISPLQGDFIDMHRMRNAIVHRQGGILAKHRPPLEIDTEDAPVLFIWGRNEETARRFVKNTGRYLGVTCNRIARAIGTCEPAPLG